MKSKLSTARTRLEQLSSSDAAPPHELQPQHKPVMSSMVQLESKSPNHSMQPPQLGPSDLRHNPHQLHEQHQRGTDADKLNLPAIADDVVHSANVREENAQEDFDLCVICIEVAPQVRFQPCSHVVTCKPCASKVLVQSGECPMCRGQLSGLELLTV